MAMSRSNGVLDAIGKIITYIVVVLLVLGIAGGVAYFVMVNQGITFYVEYSGQRYLSNLDGGSLWLAPSEKHEFSVKSLTGDGVDFSVKVASNSANNFSFTVGTEQYWLYNEDDELDDFSDIFGLETSATGFSLTIPQDMTVEKALEQKYGGSISPESAITEYTDYFVITVTADDGTVNLSFNNDPMRVTLDRSEFIIGDVPMSEVKSYSIFALYYVDSIDYSVYAELPIDAFAGEKIDFTIDYDRTACEITRVVLLDEADEIISELQEKNGVYSFVMPAEIVSVWIYSASI